MTADPFRLRLKLPNGAELEAEGSPDFVQAERTAFLAQTTTSAEQRPAGSQTEPRKGPSWEEITETRAGGVQLRAKTPGKTDSDACLLLLAAAHKLLNAPKPTAAQVARWLRASGYPVGRIDRLLAQVIQRGEILASGSRRARRYELTSTGRAKAFLLAEELSRAINGAARS